MVSNYLGNRRGFYETLLERLPEPVIRERIEAAAGPRPASVPDSFSATTIEEFEDDFLAALKTLDVMKKPTYGTALGRTTISVEEALHRAMDIETWGVVLFSHLAERAHTKSPVFSFETERVKQALANLLRLHDELRYHKLSALPLD